MFSLSVCPRNVRFGGDLVQCIRTAGVVHVQRSREAASCYKFLQGKIAPFTRGEMVAFPRSSWYVAVGESKCFAASELLSFVQG